MSRIDKALRVWEGTANVEEVDVDVATATSEAFRLTEYPRERHPQIQPLKATPAVAPVEEHAPRPVFLPEARPAKATRQVPTPASDLDLRARLVTGGADPVSLEQYRRLAAALHDAQVERGLKTIMITSALPGEGKTLTVANLALTLSESYARRVLVIDADLRWPSLHQTFGVANSQGLSEALDAGNDPAVVEVSSRLSLMTAGKPGPAPLAGLTSARMGALLKECAARFDWVLVDSSPVGVLPDGQVLARLIGAVILVIKAGSTPSATVERAVADLGPEYILGTVLNRVEPRRIPDAGYYAKYRAPAVAD
jgi:capsular exopolysaccharide synthesis family protein